MSPTEIEETYRLVAAYHSKYLADRGVDLPTLRKGDNFTVDALVLVYLAKDYPATQWVSKTELTRFVRGFRPNINDVQSARHLGMQKGFYIVSSRRGNYLPEGKPPPNESAYLLVSLEAPHPAFLKGRRQTEASFEDIKKAYNFRCATCGSEEGQPNLRYPKVSTRLQQAHCNPKLPLSAENSIPQCQFCNRADRNYWVYDKRGRVIGVASVRPIQSSIRKGYLDARQIQDLYLYLKRWLKNQRTTYEGS